MYSFKISNTLPSSMRLSRNNTAAEGKMQSCPACFLLFVLHTEKNVVGQDWFV